MCSLHKFIVMNIVAAALIGIEIVGTGQVVGAGVVINANMAAVVVEVDCHWDCKQSRGCHSHRWCHH